MILCPNGDLKLLCYVDSDFGALFGPEKPEHPVAVKSRTGYLISWVCAHSMGVKTLYTN